MGQWIKLETAAGSVRAWQAHPPAAPRGTLIVLQEIFGLNAHVRAVADGFAADGYLSLAPALFDPIEAGVELAYDAVDTARGVELRNALGFDRAVHIVEAAACWLRGAGHSPCVVGYCWGGSVAFLANTRLGLPAVSYYGARSLPFLDEALRAPMLFHFGACDASIPAEAIELHRQKQPEAAIHVYADAGHAFNRDVDNAHYHAASAALARQRTLAFLAEHGS